MILYTSLDLLPGLAVPRPEHPRSSAVLYTSVLLIGASNEGFFYFQLTLLTHDRNRETLPHQLNSQARINRLFMGSQR